MSTVKMSNSRKILGCKIPRYSSGLDRFFVEPSANCSFLLMKLDRFDRFPYSKFVFSNGKKKSGKVSKAAQRAQEKYIKAVVEPAERLLSYIEELKRKSATSRRQSA